jgi:hypothetical protein
VKKLSFVLALAAPLSAQAAETGDLLRFVACPVYRDADSGKKSGCWLADDVAGGARYDVSLSPYKPDWNKAVLVEGRLSGASETACGAKVMDPVRTSVLPESCQRHMLPAEGFPGRKFVLPKRNVDPASIVRKAPEGPFAERTFALFFEFDRSFVVYQYSDYLLDKAVTWLAAAKPRKVVVTGFAASDPERVSGHSIAERAEVARERAELVAESIHRMLPDLVIETQTETGAKPADLPDADGIPGQSQRRVEISALF